MQINNHILVPVLLLSLGFFSMGGLSCSTSSDPPEGIWYAESMGFYQGAQTLTEQSLSCLSKDIDKLAVYGIQNEGSELQKFNRQLSQELAVALAATQDKTFSVMERHALDKALRETQFNTNQSYLDKEDIVSLGDFVPADAVLIGETLPIGDSHRVSLRIISTETGEILSSATVFIVLTPDLAVALDLAAPTAPNEEGIQELEIFSSWGNEETGILELKALFKDKYPGVTINHFSSKPDLDRRLQEDTPPDAFQVHAGQELIGSWVETNKVQPVGFVLEDNNWLDKYPQGLIDIISKDGDIYSIPVNIHRSNVLWYNKAVFSENSIDPPSTLDEFFSVADSLSEAGVTPIALGDSARWPSTHIFESLLLASLGVSGYRGLFDGTTAWDGQGVKKALAEFEKMLQYVNPNHRDINWSQAAQMVADGEAAMSIMGDWTDGYFKSQNLTPGEDFGWAPSPGTEGAFLMLSDSFALPKGVSRNENSVRWLELCASKEGQDVFNPLKGSIPARTDADTSLYDPYLSSAMEDYASNEIVPSILHGAAVKTGWKNDISGVIDNFVVNPKVEAAANRLANVASRYGE